MDAVDLTSLDPWQVLVGFVVSSLGGGLALWLLVERLAWGHLAKHGVSPKPSGLLTVPLGICERASYTAAFLLGVPAWVGVWLALKVAAKWKRWQGEERGTYNVFLIGNLLSIAFGLFGAWIAAGQIRGLAGGKPAWSQCPIIRR